MLSSRTVIACGKRVPRRSGHSTASTPSPTPISCRPRSSAAAGRQAIQIDVEERQPAAAILVHDRERGAADLLGIGAEAPGHATHERGLAGTERARQQHHVAGAESRAASSPASASVAASDSLIDSRASGRGRRSGGRATRWNAAPMCRTRSPAVIDDLPLRLGGQIAGGAVQEHRELTRRFGVEQLRQPRRQHARQDVAGAAGGHPRDCRSG